MSGHSSSADLEGHTELQQSTDGHDVKLLQYAVIYLQDGVIAHCQGAEWLSFVLRQPVRNGLEFVDVVPTCQQHRWRQSLQYTEKTSRPTLLSCPLGCLRNPVMLFDLSFSKEEFEGRTCVRCHIAPSGVVFDCSDEALARENSDEISDHPLQSSEAADDIRPSEVSSRNERLFQLFRDGVVLSRNHVIESVNQAFVSMLGYTHPAELIGRSMWDMVDPAEYDDIRARLQLGPDVEWAEPVQRTYIRKDGSRIRVESSATFLTHGEDQIGAIVVRDLTERTRREEALRDSQERYRSLVELSPDPILLTEGDRIVMASPAARKMVGLEDGESALGRSVVEFVPEEYHDRIAEKVALAGFGRWPEPERFEIKRRDGTRVPVEVIAHQFPVKGYFGATIIVHDISTRLAAEQALKQSEERWQAAIEGSQLGVWDWHPQTGERHWSGRYWEMLGYEPDEISIDGASDFAKLIHAEDRKAFTSAFLSHYRGKVDYFDAEFRIRCKGGNYKWVHARGQVIERTEAGKPLRFIGTQLDIDARKEAELEIAKLNELVSERAQQLEITNRDLESFSYSVSHDLRGPLRSIDGFTAILEKDYGHLFDADGVDGLKRVRAAAARMSELINDLLALSRVSRSEIVRTPFSLTDLAEAIFREVQVTRLGRQIEVSVKPNIRCCADQRLVRIVLENLIDNALKFTKHRELTKIEIGVLKRDNVRTYYVKDNGAGFDNTHGDKLFQPFVRMHGSQEYEGQGIGLATVQKIVAKHGGKVSIEAEVDRGATVYFSLGEIQCSRRKCGCKITGTCEFRD